MKKYFFLIAIFVFIYFLVLKYCYTDWDLWARLAVGSIFFQTGQVFKHDIFAYTSTKPLWVDHEWGTGVVFYYLTHFFGDRGILFLKFLILLFIFIFIFNTNQLREEKEENPYRLSYYALLFLALLPAFANTMRSHSFTYLFFALWIYLLDLVKRGNNKLIWLFPATIVLWANLHGGFLAGLCLVGLYTLGEAISRRAYIKYLGILLISSLATFINPYGVKYWTFLFKAVSMNRPYVPEWEPLNLFGTFSQVIGFKILAIMTIISFAYLFAKKLKHINWTEILILCVTFYMSLKHIRHIIFFVIASASYIYYYFYPAVRLFTFDIIGKLYSAFPDKLRKITRYTKDIVVYGFILLIGLLMVNFSPLKLKIDKNQFPTRAVKFIRINHLDGNLLVLFNWGSYALWKLYPHNLIAVDGRYEEVYTDELIGKVVRFHYVGHNWSDLLTAYKTDVVLVPLEYEVYKKILFSDDWKIIYKDNIAAVFVPKSNKNNDWKPVPKNFNADKDKYDTDLIHSIQKRT